MVDALKREITFSEEILKESGLAGQNVKICYDPELRRLILIPDYNTASEMFFIESAYIDEDGKMLIPDSIREAFPKETFLPVRKKESLNIFIIG